MTLPPRGVDNQSDTAVWFSNSCAQAISMRAYLICTGTRRSTYSSTIDVIAVFRISSTKSGYDVPSSDLIGVKVCVVWTDRVLYRGFLLSIVMQRSACNNLKSNSQQEWWAAHDERGSACINCVYRCQRGHTWKSDYSTSRFKYCGAARYALTIVMETSALASAWHFTYESRIVSTPFIPCCARIGIVDLRCKLGVAFCCSCSTYAQWQEILQASNDRSCSLRQSKTHLKHRLSMNPLMSNRNGPGVSWYEF